MSGGRRGSGDGGSQGGTSPPPPPVPWLTELAVVAFGAVALALAVLRSDYDPPRRYVSEYAIGPGGWAMRTGFLALGVGSLNLVPGLLRTRSPEGYERIGWALAAWGGAVVVAALFPVDPQGTPTTLGGTVHLAASGVGFLGLFAAMALAARRFRDTEGWRDLAGLTRGFAVATPAAFLLEATVFATVGWVGVGQWILFGLAGSWLVVLARRLGEPEG